MGLCLVCTNLSVLQLHILFRVAVLNFPGAYGLPEPQPAPQRDRSQEMEQPLPSFSKYVHWDKVSCLWLLDTAYVDKLRECGIHAPTSYLIRDEAIKAKQTCGPCQLRFNVCTFCHKRALQYCRNNTLRPVCSLSMCLWGNVELSKAENILLSEAEMEQLQSEHKCVQRECCRDCKLAPELVARSATVRRVVAEVAATSSEHRRAAAKREVGDYRGVQRKGKWSDWLARICSMEDGKRTQCEWGQFESKRLHASAMQRRCTYTGGACSMPVAHCSSAADVEKPPISWGL